MLNTVIFDFDGTIANTYPMALEIAKDLAREKGYDIPEELRKLDIDAFKGLTQKELLGMLPFSMAKIPFYLKKIRERMLSNLEDIPPYEGMPGVIEALSENYRLGIITSNSQELTEKFLEKNNMQKYFEEVRGGISLFGKPGKIRKVLKNIGSSSEQAVCVGDDERDIAACNADEVPIISVTWGYQSRDVIETAAPDYIADSPDEILKIVKAIS